MTTYTDPRNFAFHIREMARALRPHLYNGQGVYMTSAQKKMLTFERKNIEKVIVGILKVQCLLGYRLLLPVPRVLTERQRLAARNAFQNGKPIHEIVADVLDTFPFVELEQF